MCLAYDQRDRQQHVTVAAPAPLWGGYKSPTPSASARTLARAFASHSESLEVERDRQMARRIYACRSTSPSLQRTQHFFPSLSNFKQ